MDNAEYGAYGKQFVDYYGLKLEDFNSNIPMLTFKNIDKELKPFLKKNKELLKDTKSKHLELIVKSKIKI